MDLRTGLDVQVVLQRLALATTADSEDWERSRMDGILTQHRENQQESMPAEKPLEMSVASLTAGLDFCMCVVAFAQEQELHEQLVAVAVVQSTELVPEDVLLDSAVLEIEGVAPVVEALALTLAEAAAAAAAVLAAETHLRA